MVQRVQHPKRRPLVTTATRPVTAHHDISTKLRILLAEDDAGSRGTMTEVLIALGHDVVAAVSSGVHAADKAREMKPDAVILDVHMPETSGVELLEELRRKGVGAPAVIMSGRGDHAIGEAAKRLGATMLAKPPDDDILMDLIAAALARP